MDWTKEELLAALKKLQRIVDGEAIPSGVRFGGICGTINDMVFDGYNIPNDTYRAYIDSLHASWCFHSGSVNYPVPSPSGDSASLEYMRSFDMWIGEYGASRRTLLHHMIKEVEQDVAEF